MSAPGAVPRTTASSDGRAEGTVEASPPPSPREALLHEIVANGIAHAAPERPIVSRDGRGGTRWIMSFLGVGLREPWLSTASDLLLEALGDFRGRQIATMGTSATSLVAGCVLRSGGECGALLVRPEPKAYGSARQIEGLADPDEPVVIVDDAVGTGHSALACAAILEAAGFEVEGVICLVRFTYDSGYGLLEERGLRVRALYDVYEDIVPLLEPELAPTPDPWRVRDAVHRDEPAPERTSPFALVRLWLGQYRETRSLSRPPRALAAGLHSPGGLWISLRERAAGAPIARAGAWCLHGEPMRPVPALLAEACWRLAGQLPRDGLDPERFAIGLSLIGTLEPCTAGELDQDRFGVLCRSRERPWITGSALPRMPGIVGTAHQLRHALHIGGLRPLEPVELFRFTVAKLVEPGARWPAGGSSAVPHPDPARRDRAAHDLLARARRRLLGRAPETGDLAFPLDADYLFVSVHADDAPRACLGSRCRTIADVDALVDAAGRDPRLRGVDPARAWIGLNELTGRDTRHGEPPAFDVGRDALGVTIDGVESVLLPSVAVEGNLDADGVAALLLAKRDADDARKALWSRFEVQAWLSAPEGESDTAYAPGIEARDGPWVVSRATMDETPERAAPGWFRWLADRLYGGTLSEFALPASGETGPPAGPALYAETVRRLVRAAPIVGLAPPVLPYDLLPRAPDAATLAHAHGAVRAAVTVDGVVTDDRGGLGERLRGALAALSPRHEPVAFWLAVESCGALDDRARRWRRAPVGPYARLLRAAADPLPDDADWLLSLASADGEVRSTDAERDDVPIAARAAEALARSGRPADLVAARRILARLARLGLRLGDGAVAVRASPHQTGLCTEHTVAALGAFAALASAEGAHP